MQIQPDKSDRYRVWIVWGEDPTELRSYDFGTQGELDAFLLALNEKDGWLGSADFRLESEAIEFLQNAIEEKEDIVLLRLQKRIGGPTPHVSMPEIIEWASETFGVDDPDVEELADLESEYDALRDRAVEIVDEGDDE